MSGHGHGPPVAAQVTTELAPPSFVARQLFAKLHDSVMCLEALHWPKTPWLGGQALFLSGGADKIARLWTQEGKILQELQGHKGCVCAAIPLSLRAEALPSQTLEKSRLLLTADMTGKIYLWQLSAPKAEEVGDPVRFFSQLWCILEEPCHSHNVVLTQLPPFSGSAGPCFASASGSGFVCIHEIVFPHSTPKQQALQAAPLGRTGLEVDSDDASSTVSKPVFRRIFDHNFGVGPVRDLAYNYIDGKGSEKKEIVLAGCGSNGQVSSCQIVCDTLR